jgi:hypothetical protein
VVRAALVPGLGQVAALERELAQLEAVPELGHLRAQLAVLARRTKLVTATHRPDPVPLLEAEEDLAAAVAETTREPAATEAARAWAAADSAAVEAAGAAASTAGVAGAVEAVVVVVVVAVAVAAAEAGDEKSSVRKHK